MPDARDAELESLRKDLESLRTTVAALDAELRAARGRVDLTMRNQQRCRACGNRKIAHALSVLDRGDSNTRESLALNRPSWWSSKTQGELEAFVCMKCGLVEWWVKDPESLRPHEDYLAIIDSEPDPNGPYR
jgi:ribosomal protein L32